VAARLGALRAIQQLAALGADINYENMYRHTALIAAAEVGNVQVINHLVNLGADVNRARRCRSNLLTPH
jgi:ankyrin repeat protein